MINSIRETQKKRFQYLLRLYEQTNGDQLESLDSFELGAQLGYSQPETNRIYDFLEGEGLIARVAGARIAISHRGIVEVENALSKPDAPTTYFPPVNYIHIDQMIGSQIQQGTHQSTQVFSYSSTDLQVIRDIVSALKDHLNDLPLDGENRAQAKSEIETIEIQVEAPWPKSAVLLECLKSLRAILEGAAGSIIAAGVLQQIAILMK